MSNNPMENYKETISKYLYQALDALEHNFNPKTAADASNFAMILAGLEIIEKKGEKKESKINDEAPAFLSSSAREISYILKAREKLDAVDKHYNMAEYRIAFDTLKHAEHYIEKAKSKACTKEEKEAVCDLKTKHSLMAQALSEKSF